MMLSQLIDFVIASIFPPLRAITLNREPMNTWIINFGVTIAVASANVDGFTVSKVEMAPFEIEYGNGHNLIIHRSLRPSRFRTKVSAANLVSCSTSRWTYLERMVRETMKEHRDPKTVADATMNQLAN